MRLLYLFNLFIICCSSFINQPAYLPMRFRASNISYDTKCNIKYKNLELVRHQLILNLKNNNNDYFEFENIKDIHDNDRKIKGIIIYVIYNLIYNILTHI